MRPILLLSLLLSSLLPAGLAAQHLSGRVTAATGEPVEYANVAIFTEGTYVTGVATDSAGAFELALPAAGTYEMEVSYLGLETLKQSVSLTATETHRLQPIILAASGGVDLAQVQITATRPQVIRRADRLLFLPNESPLVVGNSVAEIFNLLPGVFLNEDGGITINGRPGTRVMLNGVMQRFGGEELKQFLSSLRAEDLERIEIIAIPGAEFSAEGAGGIISIITKRRLVQGFNSRLFTNYQQGRYPYISYGAFNSLQLERTALYLNAYRFNSQGYSSQDATQTDAAGTQVQRQTAYTRERTDNYQIRVGGNFEPAPNHLAGVEYIRTSNDNAHTTKGLLASQGEVTDFTIPFNSGSLYQNLTANYGITLDTTGRSLRLLTDFTHHELDQRFDFRQPEPASRTVLPGLTKLYAAQLDFQDPIRGFDLGIKANLTERDNGYQRFQMLGGANPIPEEELDFLYSELVYAAYANYNTSLGKLQLKLGLRGEATDLEGSGADGTVDFANQYFGIYPSFFAALPLGTDDKYGLRLSYSRRLGRPDFEVLNPYRYRTDYLYATQGNPDLIPSSSHTVEGGLTFLQRYDLSLYYQRVDDLIGQLILQDEEEAVVTQQNLASSSTLGTTLYLPAQFGERFSLNNTVSVYESHFELADGDRRQTTLEWQANATLSLKPLQLQAAYSLETRKLFGNIVAEPNQGLNVGVLKRFLNNQLTVQALLRDVFNTRNKSGIASWNGLTIVDRTTYQSRYLSLYVAYNLSGGKRVRDTNIESANGDERSRLGNN